MPVKIVSTATNSSTGEITNGDRNKMINDFIADISLVPLHGRSAIEKKFKWFVTREEVEALFILNKTADGNQPTLLEINFAVNLTGVTDICQNSLANSLTIVLQGTNDSKLPVNPAEEYVIIPGFNNFNTTGFAPIMSVDGKGCCPSSNP